MQRLHLEVGRSGGVHESRLWCSFLWERAEMGMVSFNNESSHNLPSDMSVAMLSFSNTYVKLNNVMPRLVGNN